MRGTGHVKAKERDEGGEADWEREQKQVRVCRVKPMGK